jgi:hypothetical protein
MIEKQWTTPENILQVQALLSGIPIDIRGRWSNMVDRWMIEEINPANPELGRIGEVFSQQHMAFFASAPAIVRDLLAERMKLRAENKTLQEERRRSNDTWHEAAHQLIDDLKARDETIRRLHEERTQLEVQLAACMTTAEGVTEQTAQPGDYGYSGAYQAVLDLRRRFDELRLEERD